MTTARTRLTLLSLPIALAMLASACSSTSNAESPATSTTEARATTTTEAPTTTAATTTTEAPTTTAAPTTTLAPLPTIPSRVETIAPLAKKLTAVGKKSGEATKLIQSRLTELGFWAGAIDGQYGFATTQAVMAFQKYVAIPTSGIADAGTIFMLQGWNERAHGSANTGTLVEVDKTKQLLFIIQDGRTVWTMNTSTGSEIPYESPNKKDPTKIEKGDAVTPNGLYKTNRERPEGWWEGDLGKIYRPKYFRGGIAIHGMTSVPDHPASHGCVRLSTQAMDFIWDKNLVPIGMPVWVHGG